MLTPVKCPACQFKFSIPEGEMGKRQVCPNCRSPFFAGQSVVEAEAAGLPPSYAKTMLGETAPPIKFNCPRCKASQEAEALEAGTKKNCSACGQRLQVPAAPRPAPAPQPAAASPNLNMTLLAADESKAAPPIQYNCPNCKKPLESPASEAGSKKNCSACGQRFQVPAASTAGPNLNKTILATEGGKAPAAGGQAGYPSSVAAGVPGAATVTPGHIMVGSIPLSPRNLAIGAGILFLLLIVLPAFIRGGKRTDEEALARTQLELAKLKEKIEQKKVDVERQKLAEAETHRTLERMEGKYRDLVEQMRENHRQSLAAISDQNQRAQMAAKHDAEERRLAQARSDHEKETRRLLEEQRAKLDAKQRELDAAKQRQTTIIQQPPPYIYYPYYHPRYYWPW